MKHILYFLLIADFWKLACLIYFLVSPKYLTCSLVCHPEFCWMGSFCQGLGFSFCWAPFPFLLIALGVTARILHPNRQGRDWLETKVFVSTNTFLRKNNVFWAPWEVHLSNSTRKAEENQRKGPTGRKKTFLPWPSQGCKRQLNESATISLTKKRERRKKKSVVCTQSLQFEMTKLIPLLQGVLKQTIVCDFFFTHFLVCVSVI